MSAAEEEGARRALAEAGEDRVIERGRLWHIQARTGNLAEVEAAVDEILPNDTAERIRGKGRSRAASWNDPGKTAVDDLEAAKKQRKEWHFRVAKAIRQAFSMDGYWIVFGNRFALLVAQSPGAFTIGLRDRWLPQKERDRSGRSLIEFAWRGEASDENDDSDEDWKERWALRDKPDRVLLTRATARALAVRWFDEGMDSP